MTFYLKPAGGSIPSTLFANYALCRLKYLAVIRDADFDCDFPTSIVQHADCLLEGSVKDRVSHFALRSVSLLHPPLHTFVLRKERLLFVKRLKKMGYREAKASLTQLYVHLGEYSQEDTFFEEVRPVVKQILENRVLDHVSHCDGSDTDTRCPHHQSKLIVGVPFTHVLPYVAKRQCILVQGQAWFRCDQMLNYLADLFVNVLEKSSDRMARSSTVTKIAHDSRFQHLLTGLKHIYFNTVPVHRLRKSIGNNGFDLSFRNLDKMSALFPPCMRAMHYTLKTRHRLCHKPRVQYTLYLKEVGLPVDDFLKVMEAEYSHPIRNTGQSNERHVCEHSWQKDGRRYKYGTRHLYGLEGAKKDYSSHSCNTIQRESPGPNQCGGCPFKHFDKENLRQFLTFDFGGSKENADKFLEQIQHESTLPIEACHKHLRFKIKEIGNAKEGSQDPSQDLRTLENSQVKMHSVMKPKHYFNIMLKHYRDAST